MRIKVQIAKEVLEHSGMNLHKEENMFVITSATNGLTGLSETNGSVEFHNTLWGVTDVIIVEQPNENFIETP